MLSSIGRAAIRRVGAGTWHASTNRGLQSIWQLLRVDSSTNTDNASLQAGFSSSLQRAYATVTQSTLSKKRTTAKPKTTEAGAKKVVKKAVKKKPASKKKVAAKKKPKPQARPRPKKILSDEEKLKAKAKEWKTVALLSEPKKKTTAVWNLVLQDTMRAAKRDGDDPKSVFKATAAEASTKFKSLSPEEIEHYNQKASKNKADNDIAYKEWVTQYTPDQIRNANIARAALKRRKIKSSHNFLPIQDERLPLRPRSSLNFFTQERWSSGDMKGLAFPEATALIVKEFKDLPASERKVLDDRVAADLQRYEQEYRTVFHRDNPATTRNRAASV
ncbi:hypothetical protein B7494_g3130 [Chlorociboria aeruginascens]|nr:hypothetical protein B7494_g3130 [Chlorociboria aeruginascens]